MDKERKEKLLCTARNTFVKLREFQQENGCFVDRDKMTAGGVLPESIGLVSILLMAVAFQDNKKVLQEGDLSDIAEMARKAVSAIDGYVQDGYTADPIVPSRSTKGIFFRENDTVEGYIDTITWILSATILMRYLVRKDIIRFDPETVEKSYRLMTETLRMLLNSQQEATDEYRGGTWGFCTDKMSDKSLYYTYTVCATLGDFKDYILDEISMVENRALEVDQEMIDRLEQEKGLDHVAERVNSACTRLQDWLLYDCMPLMPQLASCGVLSDEARARLGIWKVDSDDNYARFYNLNYSYFLLDMMVLMSTDLRFGQMCEGAASDTLNQELQNLYDWFRNKQLMNDSDLRYFFGDRFNPNHIGELWKTCMEQTIHSTRTNYLIASRTGNSFWNSAELDLRWENSSDKETANFLKGLQNSIAKLKDPSILPMSLRSNTQYSYYISNRPDIAVDRLFDDICEQIAPETTDICIADLWDTNSFNLMLTERSIEALIDYYDYLNRYEDEIPEENNKAAGTMQALPVAMETVSIDSAVEARIEAYLKGDTGTALIAKAVQEALEKDNITIQAASATGGAIDVKAFNVLLKNIAEAGENLRDFAKGHDYDDSFYYLLDLYRLLVRKDLQGRVEGASKIKRLTKDERKEKTRKISDVYLKQLDYMLELIAQEGDKTASPTYYLSALYKEWLDNHG